MSRAAVILRNVASNWAGFAFNAGITLVLTPFILHELGAARYGIWVLTSSVIGYYGLLDLGFRAGVTQSLTRYLSVGDTRKASECISSAVVVLGALGAIMIVLSVLAATMAPHLFTLPAGTEREAFWCILIVGCSTGVQFALQPYTSIFTATQRFDLASAIGVATRLLTAASIVVSLKSSWGLIGLSAATCLTSGVDYSIRWYVSRRLAPGLEVSFRHRRWSAVREVGAFGAWNFLLTVNAFVYQHVPNILISTFMPVAAVGQYALATGLARQINSVLTPVPQVLYPAAAELYFQNKQAALERLYHDGSRVMILMMSTIVLIAGVFAHDFYRLWIGEKFLTGVPFDSVSLLFKVLLVGAFTTYSSSIATQILMGAGRIRAVAISLICGSVVNLTLSLILIRTYGLVAIAVSTVIASVVIDLFVMPVLIHRVLGLSLWRFIGKAWSRPLVVIPCQAAYLFALRLSFGAPTTWMQLTAYGIAAGAGAAGMVLLIGINAEERERFLMGRLRRIVRARAAAVNGTLQGTA